MSNLSKFILVGENPPFDISITVSVKRELTKAVNVLWRIKGSSSGLIKSLFVERSIDQNYYYAVDMRSVKNPMQLSVTLNSSFNDACEFDGNRPSYRIKLVMKNNLIFSTPSILAPKTPTPKTSTPKKLKMNDEYEKVSIK